MRMPPITASERAHSVPQRRSRRVPFRSVEAGAFRSVSALWRKLHIHFPASPYRITTTSLGRDARGEKAPHGPDHPLLPLRGNSPCPFPRSSLSSETAALTSRRRDGGTSERARFATLSPKVEASRNAPILTARHARTHPKPSPHQSAAPTASPRGGEAFSRIAPASPGHKLALWPGKEERGSGYGDAAFTRRRNGARPF